MKITLRNRDGELVVREVHMQQKLIGLRIDSVTFEGWEEVKEVFSEENRRWVDKCLIPAMRIKQ